MKKTKKDFLSVADLTVQEIWQVLKLSKKLKNEWRKKGEHKKAWLKDKTLGMIFEKPSLRTRISFEAGMTQLGGHAIYLGPSDIGLGKREAVSDIAIVTSSMVDIIMARTFKHEHVVELGKYSSVPVINALTDWEHPCQILADIMTIWEVKGKLEGLKMAFVGDGDNNVTHSLCLIAAMFKMDFSCGAPKGFWMNKKIVRQAKMIVGKNKSLIEETADPSQAVKKADVVITDTWVSMGNETEKQKRLKLFKPYQVTQELMKLAKKQAIFLHCLPAYRGSEVAGEVIDGKQSVVFEEAENRMHVQKALMLFLLGEK